MKTPAYNYRVFWFAMAGLAAFMLAGIVWDLYLFRIDPSGEHTISWSIAVVTAENPGLAFLIGLGTGATVAGLAAHFWFGQMKVSTWMQLQDVRFKCLCAAEGLRSNIPEMQKMIALHNAADAIAKAFPYGEKSP